MDSNVERVSKSLEVREMLEDISHIYSNLLLISDWQPTPADLILKRLYKDIKKIRDQYKKDITLIEKVKESKFLRGWNGKSKRSTRSYEICLKG